MPKKLEIKLGQYLVQKRRCSLSQVNEALLEQSNLRKANLHRPLGQLLVEKGAIHEETLRMALCDLGVLHLQCPSCHAVFPQTTYARDSNPTCPTCNGALILADPETVPAPQPAAAPVAAPREAPVRGAQPDAPAPRGAVAPASPVPGDPVPALISAPAPSADPAPQDSAREAYVGKVLGGCQLLEKVGHGGMGMVFKAKQLNLGRIVAVKVLPGNLAKDASFVRRFYQEARSAAQLNHGNIIHINDFGEHQGIYYFVMEFVDGPNLKEILKTCERFEIPRAISIVIQVCHALRHAHNRSIIHRDIKPENIMITEEGIVKLADLGLAKRMASDAAVGLTHAGSILGTPYYMAPEQAKDFSKVDARSDIYSLGVTLYKMLTGKVPFDGRTPIEVMIKAIDGKKVPVREIRPEVSPDLEAIVDKMMHRHPDKRYQDVGSLLEDLQKASVLATAVV